MLHSVAKLYEVPFSKNLGKSSIASLLGGATTYAIGSVFAQHFESGGTLLDFDAKKMRSYFSNKLAEGKDVVANLKPGETQTSG
jgi:membrane protein YqaA with SNARE-associated domain